MKNKKTFLVSFTYISEFRIQAETKKEAIKILENNKNQNFYISVYPASDNTPSLTHTPKNGDMRYYSESIDYKAKEVFKCKNKKCQRIVRKPDTLCEYC